MDQQTQQLVTYIQSQITAGVPAPAIKQALLQNNWNPQLVDQAFAQVSGFSQSASPTSTPAMTQSESPKHKKKAILWITSPFIVFAIAVIIALIGSVVTGGSDSGGLTSMFSILTTIFGLIGFVLLVVGPLLGILLLKKK